MTQMITPEDKFIINLVSDNYDRLGNTSADDYFTTHDLNLLETNKFKYVTGMHRFDTLESSFFTADNIFVPQGTSIYLILYQTLGKRVHMMTWSPNIDLSNVFAYGNSRIISGTKNNYSHLKLVRRHFRFPKSWPNFIKALSDLDSGIE